MKKSAVRGCYSVALAGNPNVGKSTVFNALSGMHQHTGNWAGKTVGNAEGKYIYNEKQYKVTDLPGTYSLSARSEEERYADEFLLSANYDLSLIVCDATSLERNLILAFQIAALSPRALLCVNLMDEAEKKGICVDLAALEKLVGFPVIGISAHKKADIKRLKKEIEKVCAGEYEYPQNTADEDIDKTVERAEKTAQRAVSVSGKGANRDLKLDKIFTSRVTGAPIMLLLLLLIFWITISGANYPSELLSRLMSFLEEHLADFLGKIGVSAWLVDMLSHGVFRVLGWVVSVMLPPMAIFFPLFTLLEDFGYLPRVAYNLDHYFKKAGTCGKQALTMCMGFGCNAVGVTGARIIDSPRERLIAIITNSLVPCNGRFPALISVISMFLLGAAGGAFKSVMSALVLTAAIVFSVFMTFLISRLLSKTLLRGVTSSFTLEMPPYRRPQVLKVIVRSVFDRTLFVLGRAAAVAAPAGLVIWIMANVKIGNDSLLSVCADFLDPFARLLGLDGKILTAFILGFPANETVLPITLMAYLSEGTLSQSPSLAEMKEILVQNGWTACTAVSFMLFSLMHWPCSTTLMTIKKETGSFKWTLVSLLVPTAAGVIICFVFNLAVSVFNYIF